MLLAGANAVQVGTATLADPRAPRRVLDELRALLVREGVGSVADDRRGRSSKGGRSGQSAPAGLR